MGKKVNKGVVSFSLSADLVKTMLRIKEVDGVPLSQQAERALRMWIDARESTTSGMPPVIAAPGARARVIYLPPDEESQQSRKEKKKR
jgi:hypothetical protein